MTDVDKTENQSALDALRTIRRKLYAMPEAELSAMSLEDQEKYGMSIYHTGRAIMRLETARLKGVNDAFKEKEKDLKTAAASLEADAANVADTVKVIRVISDGLALITRIVEVLD